MSDVQSYNTAMSRKGPSAPLKYLKNKGFLSGAILDYGCGKGADFKYLREEGFEAEAYDPHWRSIDLSSQSFDTILCTYVLNVVNESTQDDIISSVKSLLKKGGQAFLTVRRDIKNEGQTSRGFQRIVNLDMPVVKETSGYCIYKL